MGPPKKTVQGASGEDPWEKKKQLQALTGGQKSEGAGVRAFEEAGHMNSSLQVNSTMQEA